MSLFQFLWFSYVHIFSLARRRGIRKAHLYFRQTQATCCNEYLRHNRCNRPNIHVSGHTGQGAELRQWRHMYQASISLACQSQGCMETITPLDLKMTVLSMCHNVMWHTGHHTTGVIHPMVWGGHRTLSVIILWSPYDKVIEKVRTLITL